MRYLFLCFVLVGCEVVQDEVIKHHWLAKGVYKDNQRVCYSINYPRDLEGRYCLEYVGGIE